MAKEYDIARANETDSGWSLWKRDRMVASESDLGVLLKGHHDVVVALPVAYCTTFSQMLPTQDASVFEDMVFAQIEKRGLAGAAGSSAPFDFHVVENKDGGTVLSVDVLIAELPDFLCVSSAAAYFPSSRLLNSPGENELMLWREHGALVMAASVHGHVTATLQLSASDQLGTALAQEVNLISLSLQADGSVGENPRLVLFGSFSNDERSDFEKSLVMSAEYHAAADFRLEADASEHMARLLPIPVKEGRDRKKRAHKRNAIIMAVCALYVVVGAFLWVYANQTKKSIESLQQLVESNRPAVKNIEEAALRWQELAPAFDLKRYPLVQLNEVTRLMPPTGILIREFETKGSTIRINGQARDAQIAIQFEEDLKSSEFLTEYQWNMPRPKVSKNNTATFEIHGELSYEKSE